MAHINLLPWREELRKERQRQFLTVLGLSVILMALIILAAHLRIDGMIDNQQSRNRYLQGEIKKVEQQIKEINRLEKEKKRLLARMDIIQQLQRNRPEVVHLFDEMARIIPDGIHLTQLTQKGKTIVLNGIAQSNARVSAFMRNIEASDWLADPQLEIIQKKGKGKASESDSARNFVMKLTQVRKEQNTEQKKK